MPTIYTQPSFDDPFSRPVILADASNWNERDPMDVTAYKYPTDTRGWTQVLDSWLWTGGGEPPVNSPWDNSNASRMGSRMTGTDLQAAFDALPESEKAIYRASGVNFGAYYQANGSAIQKGNVANTLAWQTAIEENAKRNSGMDFGDYLVMGLGAAVGGMGLAGYGLVGASAATATGAVVDSAALSGVEAGWELAGAGSGSTGSFGAASVSLGEGAGTLTLAEIASMAKSAYSTASTVSSINKLLGGTDSKGLAAASYRGGSVPQGLGGVVISSQAENPATVAKTSPAETSGGFDWNAVALIGLIGFGVYLWSKK